MQNATVSPLALVPGAPLANRTRAAEALYATGHLLLGDDKPAHASGVFRAMALLAPTDERAWLGLGACHEAIGQDLVALEMYGTGRTLARTPVRAELARARQLRKLGRDDESERALERAETLAAALDDEVLALLVSEERRTA
jgi:tetratricopeptide (TPR) repeat protein